MTFRIQIHLLSKSSINEFFSWHFFFYHQKSQPLPLLEWEGKRSGCTRFLRLLILFSRLSSPFPHTGPAHKRKHGLEMHTGAHIWPGLVQAECPSLSSFPLMRKKFLLPNGNWVISWWFLLTRGQEVAFPLWPWWHWVPMTSCKETVPTLWVSLAVPLAFIREIKKCPPLWVPLTWFVRMLATLGT